MDCPGCCQIIQGMAPVESMKHITSVCIYVFMNYIIVFYSLQSTLLDSIAGAIFQQLHDVLKFSQFSSQVTKPSQTKPVCALVEK
jgi:hypothetical protein